MLLITSKDLNPYYHLAAEAFFLKHRADDLILIWRSHPSVIIGKHQNAYAEINYSYIRENKLPVARRISGGGTVFHDLGNVNFSFIQNGKPGDLVNFKRFLSPIIQALQSLGLEATMGNKNDLLLDDKKISGNAEHVFKNRVLHHGTLLYSSDISNLNQSIRGPLEKYKDKAVQSNRSKVTNICHYIPDAPDVKVFIEQLKAYFISNYKELKEYVPTTKEEQQIRLDAQQRFSTWEWIYGYSPAYTFTNSIVISGKTLGIHLFVEKGIIVDAKLQGDLMHMDEQNSLQLQLINSKHQWEGIQDILQEYSQTYNKLNPELASDIIAAFFQ